MTYWIVTLALIVFGILGGFSIGQAFLLLGLAMLVLGAVRRRPLIFWPPMLAVVAFDIVFLVVAPFSCTSTIPEGGSAGVTTCSSLLGIMYAGTGIYNPSLAPAVEAALILAAVTGLAAFAVLWMRGRPQTAGTSDGSGGLHV